MYTSSVRGGGREDRRRIYKKSLSSYGFIALCYLIQEFSDTEDYEECQLIKEVVDEANEELGLECPTTYDDAAFSYHEAYVKKIGGTAAKSFKSKEDLRKKIPMYGKKILKSINDYVPSENKAPKRGGEGSVQNV